MSTLSVPAFVGIVCAGTVIVLVAAVLVVSLLTRRNSDD